MPIITGFTESEFDFKKDNEKYQISKQKLAERFGIKISQIKHLHQTHNDQIIQITDASQDYSGVEGDCVFTTLPNVLLMTLTADCVPILFWDKNLTICGAIHLSRQTVLLGLLEKTLNLLKTKFGIKMSDLQIEFGPSLQAKNHLIMPTEAQKFDPK